MSHQPQTDIIVSVSPAIIQSIIQREKTFYECRPPTPIIFVKRIWFYLTAPESSISYICEVDNDPTTTLKGSTLKVTLTSLYRLHQPVPLAVLRKEFGLKTAPRGSLVTPPKLMENVTWQAQQLVWTTRPRVVQATTLQSSGQKKRIISVKRKVSEMDVDDDEGNGEVVTRVIKKRVRSFSLLHHGQQFSDDVISQRSIRIASRTGSSMAMNIVAKNPSCDGMDVD